MYSKVEIDPLGVVKLGRSVIVVVSLFPGSVKSVELVIFNVVGSVDDDSFAGVPVVCVPVSVDPGIVDSEIAINGKMINRTKVKRHIGDNLVIFYVETLERNFVQLVAIKSIWIETFSFIPFHFIYDP